MNRNRTPQWARYLLASAIGVSVSGLCIWTPIVHGDDKTSPTVQDEIRALKKQMEMLQKQLDRLESKTGTATPKPAATAARAETETAATTGTGSEPAPVLSQEQEQKIDKDVTASVLEKIQPSLTASANANGSANVFNPAMGLILDNALSVREAGKENFQFRAAELGLAANIDPFSRGYATITGSPDGFEVEEAAIATTELPYNLSVKGGRFFADFGRLSKFHDHDLPFVNRPLALDRFIGGESQADGVEVNWLAPTDRYLSLTAGAYNKVGAENDRADNESDRSFSQFSYLGRAATFFSLSDSSSLDLGGSVIYTPEVEEEENKARELGGLDLTYRYTPLDQSTYSGLTWGTELLLNHEERPIGGFPDDQSSTGEQLMFHGQESNGLYSYLELKLTRQWSPGFLFDYAEDLDGIHGATYTYSPYLTFMASEFQRFRAEYSLVNEDGKADNQFFLQWTAILGSHVHGFRER